MTVLGMSFIFRDDLNMYKSSFDVSVAGAKLSFHILAPR